MSRDVTKQTRDCTRRNESNLLSSFLIVVHWLFFLSQAIIPAGKVEISTSIRRRFFNAFATFFRRQIKTVEIQFDVERRSFIRRFDVETFLRFSTLFRRRKCPLRFLPNSI